MGTFDMLLVGHRGTGKSTVASCLAGLGHHVVDLDDEIERRYRAPCAELVASDEPEFRRIERDLLAALVADTTHSPRVIVCGAGCLTLPSEALVVWLRRDGWVKTAQNQRQRLRPQWPFEAEVAWMREHREPVWRHRADLLFDIPEGRDPQRVAQEIGDYMAWARRNGPIAHKTWLVAPTDAARAKFLASALGLRGVELRSDLPRGSSLGVGQTLVSLRTDDPAWLKSHQEADVVDIDERFVAAVLADDCLRGWRPRPLVVSSHPGRIDAEALHRLSEARRRLAVALPDWPITTKIAGEFESFERLADTVLPTDPAQNWRRVLNALGNEHNYMGMGLRNSRFEDVADLPPMDLQDWLPYFAALEDWRREALVGDPVEHSQGTWWHSAQTRSSATPSVYLRVATPSGTLAATLTQFEQLGIHAVSVTTPLKAEAAKCVGSPLAALNTLRWRGKWEGIDTDADGMHAVMKRLIAGGVRKGSVLLIGAGAVSAAVLRALASYPAFEVTHLPARFNGAFPASDIVINASGRRPAQCPAYTIWIDLHYRDVEPMMPIHFNGDTFFEGQAAAQRAYWSETESP
ncbi:MAG: shikimate kinase [bacterium]